MKTKTMLIILICYSKLHLQTNAKGVDFLRVSESKSFVCYVNNLFVYFDFIRLYLIKQEN